MAARSDLLELMGAASESLGVEYKSWIDTTNPEARAKLARHIAALANHGGGYLVFGVDDESRRPLEASPYDLKRFGQDDLSGIVKKYLDPRVQLQVEFVELDGASYPVVIVPSHGARPVIAIADGPSNRNGTPAGVKQGEIYIRAAGPESVAIRSGDDWNALLDRCLIHRSDLLGNILRQTLNKPSRPSTEASQLLLVAVEETAGDFSKQTAELAATVGPGDQAAIREAGGKFCVLGYALLGDDGEPVEIENPRGVIERASLGMHRYAYDGWSSFLPLSVPERAPQVRTAALSGRDLTYVEGMRLRNTATIVGGLDYWRLYEVGIGVTTESYHEDRSRTADGSPYLSITRALFRLHSLLVHARLTGQELAGVQQVLVRQDWRGLTGRTLMWDNVRYVSPSKAADDRFARTLTLPWSELRDDYFVAFRRLALPLLSVFANPGWLEPETWLTRENVEREFAKLRAAKENPLPNSSRKSFMRSVKARSRCRSCASSAKSIKSSM